MRARVRRFLDGEGTRYLIVAMACAALAFVCMGVAFAQTLVNPPCVDTSEQDVIINANFRDTWYAQSFTAPSNIDLDKVVVDGSRNDISTFQDFNFGIWTTDSNGHPDVALDTSNQAASTYGDTLVGWTCDGDPEADTTHDFFLDATLVTGNQYALVLSWPSGTAVGQTIRWRSSDPAQSASVYAGGTRLQSTNAGSSWSEQDADFMFALYGSGASTPTPTPTTQPSNYQYITTVTSTLSTSASDQTDVAVQFPINALNLTNSGYLDDDGQGILVIGGASSSAVLPTVHTGVNQASWWIPFTGTTSGGETRSADIYTSGDPSPLRPQSLWLESASESVDIVHDSSFNITDELTIDLGSFETTTLPSSDVCLLCKESQWDITLNGATLTVDIETAGGTETLTYNGVATDTPFSVKVTFYDGDDLTLYIDDLPQDIVGGLSTTLATTTNDIEISAFTGWMGRARVGGTNVDSPTYVLDLQFEPTHLTQTDAGDAGDGWTWEGTIEDQSASGNDATYLFVRDMSVWTTEVDPLSSNEDLPPPLTNNELADLFDAPNIATGTTDDILTADNTLEQLVESPGLTSSGAWFLFVSLVVIAGGGTLLVRVSQQAVVGVLFGGFALFGAGALGWLGWIWVTLGCFILVIGMSSVLWLRR